MNSRAFKQSESDNLIDEARKLSTINELNEFFSGDTRKFALDIHSDLLNSFKVAEIKASETYRVELRLNHNGYTEIMTNHEADKVKAFKGELEFRRMYTVTRIDPIGSTPKPIVIEGDEM